MAKQNNQVATASSEAMAVAQSSNSLEAKLETLKSYISSGLLPASVDTPEKALVISQYGKELGLDPMTAFGGIYVVQGRPSLSSQLMTALAMKGGVRFRIIKDGAKVLNAEGKAIDIETTIEIIRDGITNQVTFTWSDATQAGLNNSNVWNKYPKIMMYWRCVSIALRRFAPDLLAGMYSVEEAAEIAGITDRLIVSEENITINV